MLAAWLVARSIGAMGLWLHADSWTNSLRIGLAAMFVFTVVSHSNPRTRPDMVRTVPAILPAPALLVTATGVLELLGAAPSVWALVGLSSEPRRRHGRGRTSR